MLNHREKKILGYVATGRVPNLHELSEEMGVSINTVRNDYKSLEEKGLVITVRGGAIPPYYPELYRRMQQNIEVKERIAQKAAELVQDHDTIMISCGSTCSLIGRYLYGKIGVTVVTHSTLFLPYARTNPNFNLQLVGGEFLPEEDATAGMTVINELDKFYPRLAIVGSDNFSIESGITSRSLKVAEILRKILRQAQKKVLVVESRKFGNARFVKICPLEEMDIIISDQKLSSMASEFLDENNIELIIAE